MQVKKKTKLNDIYKKKDFNGLFFSALSPQLWDYNFNLLNLLLILILQGL
jgi:hypothetical protein